ncbi:Alpha-galactosidase [Meloidogyne graminicola]|uniref:Alpha-galactosidase n=1 Tax=Meloidogyne graminicola TaxID=189291 RepID=A0A8S9ZTY2_9BILA|nr:Alpha-galactosidase [Meloidogyne graminicola]
MGWMSWTKFYCEIDCVHHPFSCINERLYKDMADRMVEDGYFEAGYTFVHIDDCWMQKKRDSKGRLLADEKRFASGIEALSEYMHSKGLKLGIYEDIGTATCEGYPGTWGHLREDAKSFSDWKVDYLKLDGCNLNASHLNKGYIAMGNELNKTGRPIVYSCSWPAYLLFSHQQKEINYTLIGENCNLWRNFDDIEKSWNSILKTIEFYVKYQEIFRKAQGPGRWNDPDMIIVGNTELTLAQSRVQMAIWSIWSAPLIMSNDLRTLLPEHRQILLNKRIISVDQDPLGIFGRVVYKGKQVYVFTKEMTPAIPSKNLYSYAVAVLNYGDKPVQFSTDLKSIGLTNEGGYLLEELWKGTNLGHYSPNTIYNTTIEGNDVAMFKATLDGIENIY